MRLLVFLTPKDWSVVYLIEGQWAAGVACTVAEGLLGGVPALRGIPRVPGIAGTMTGAGRELRNRRRAEHRDRTHRDCTSIGETIGRVSLICRIYFLD